MTAPRFTIRRVRKCRWTKACGLCGVLILVGARECLIGPPDGRGPCYWVHLACTLGTMRTTAAALRAPATDRDPHDSADKEIQP